jgi:DNA-directed RNA polymerase specialized sigma24 family protein
MADSPARLAADEPAVRVRELASIFASEDAFRAFYERALPRVYGNLYARCGGERSTAEELTQQTFAEAVAPG